MLSWGSCPNHPLEWECGEPFQCIRRGDLDCLLSSRSHYPCCLQNLQDLFQRMEFGVYPFSMIGVFIASDSMQRSLLCKLAALSQARPGNETLVYYFTIILYYFILVSFILSSSRVDDFFLYLLNGKDINLGSFWHFFDKIWCKFRTSGFAGSWYSVTKLVPPLFHHRIQWPLHQATCVLTHRLWLGGAIHAGPCLVTAWLRNVQFHILSNRHIPI